MSTLSTTSLWRTEELREGDRKNVDKLIALGDKIDDATRSQTLLQAYNIRRRRLDHLARSGSGPGAPPLAMLLRRAQGLRCYKKPDNVSDPIPEIEASFYSSSSTIRALKLRSCSKTCRRDDFSADSCVNADEPVTNTKMGSLFAMTRPKHGRLLIARALSARRQHRERRRTSGLIRCGQGGPAPSECCTPANRVCERVQRQSCRRRNQLSTFSITFA